MTAREPNREGPAYALRPKRSRAERVFGEGPALSPAWDSGVAVFAEVEFGEVEALLRVERSA